MIGRLATVMVWLALLSTGDALPWDREPAGRWLSLRPIEENPPLLIVGPDQEDVADAEMVEPVENPWKAYFASPSGDFLVDVEGLLDARTASTRREFLHDHAADSPISLRVHLFGEDREMPGPHDVAAFLEPGLPSDELAVVAFFSFGDPERAALYLTPALVDAVPIAEQRRALQSAVMQAHGGRDAATQLEAFLAQLAVRIYWMERMFDDSAPDVLAETPRDMPASAPAAPTLRKPITLPGPPWLPIVLAGGVVGLAGLHLRRARIRHHFPDFDVEPRLGGRHAAGVGAVISFLSPGVRPASQRAQLPDFLRRM